MLTRSGTGVKTFGHRQASLLGGSLEHNFNSPWNQVLCDKNVIGTFFTKSLCYKLFI